MSLAYFGLHRLRVLPLDPLPIYIRYFADLTVDEARAMSQLVAHQLRERDARFLIDAALLGGILPDSRHELLAGGCERRDRRGRVLDIAIVGATIRQKVILSQILAMADLSGEARGQTQFFAVLGDALDWLGLPRTLLDRGSGTSSPS